MMIEDPKLAAEAVCKAIPGWLIPHSPQPDESIAVCKDDDNNSLFASCWDWPSADILCTLPMIARWGLEQEARALAAEDALCMAQVEAAAVRKMLIDAQAERDAARAEVEELRLTLAAEQGRQEGAPSEAWTNRGDEWITDCWAEDGEDIRVERRYRDGGYCWFWNGRRFDSAREVMLAIEAERRNLLGDQAEEVTP